MAADSKTRTRPDESPIGPLHAIAATGLSTASTGFPTSATFPIGRAAISCSAQVNLSTGSSTSATVAVDGSLDPASGWTTLKSTTWSSTQAGVMRLIQSASTTAIPFTHVRMRVTDLSTTTSTSLATINGFIAVI